MLPEKLEIVKKLHKHSLWCEDDAQSFCFKIMHCSNIKFLGKNRQTVKSAIFFHSHSGATYMHKQCIRISTVQVDYATSDSAEHWAEHPVTIVTLFFRHRWQNKLGGWVSVFLK